MSLFNFPFYYFHKLNKIFTDSYTVATFEKKGYGEFFARMRLFKSGMYTEPYKYVPSLLAYDNIYVQVDLLKADNDTKIVSNFLYHFSFLQII